MSSVNPQAMFDNLLSQNPDAKKAMDLINQYGNGDPKAAFTNYMNQAGKQLEGNAIMKQFGLK